MLSLKSLFRFVLISGLLIAPLVTAEEVVVGAFSSVSAGGDFPTGWRVAKLPGGNATRFRMVEVDGDTVVQMDAANAAATLYHPVRIDPAKTPTLRWRWRIRNLVDGADLYAKQGDDLPARLYVMFDYPLDRLPLIERAKILIVRTLVGDIVPAAALCYIWDGKLPVGTQLWNAYSDRVSMVVVQSGPHLLGQWVAEERNVTADFRAAFGEDPPPISGIAIAADTDQTGETIRSWFGDIGFSVP